MILIKLTLVTDKPLTLFFVRIGHEFRDCFEHLYRQELVMRAVFISVYPNPVQVVSDLLDSNLSIFTSSKRKLDVRTSIRVTYSLITDSRLQAKIRVCRCI